MSKSKVELFQSNFYCITGSPDDSVVCAAGYGIPVIANPSSMSDSNRLLLSLLESKSYEFEPEENPSFHQMGWSRVEWSPTGEYLAASRGFTVSLIDPKTLKEIKALPYERESSIVSMSWKSNGQELAVCDHLGAYIWNLESGKARESPHLPESGFNSLTWSPKNNLIAGVYESHANFFVKVWNPENEKVFGLSPCR